VKHINYWLLTFGGLALILAGVFLVVDVQRAPALAQDDEAPAEARDYIGADECQSCHRDLSRSHADSYHGRALIEVGRNKDDILANFEVGEDVRTVQFPEEDAPRAFTVDDIAYVLGAGRYAQDYVYEIKRGVYRVFPAKWNVTTQAWDAFTPADSWEDTAYDFVTQCAGCHTSGLDVERGRWLDDGVMCESCHGPASEHEDVASDAGRRPNDEELVAIRASINPGTDPQTCGACHSRGAVVEGVTAFSTTYRPGDTLTDSYVPFAADDTMHWYATGHAGHQNMQYNEWLLSGHAQSLVALVDSEYAEDSCLVCHSADATVQARRAAAVEEGDREGEPPVAPTVADAQYGVSCSSCHYPHVENDLPNNMLADSDTLCLSCHTDAQPFDEFVHHPLRQMNEGLPVIEGIEPVENPHMSPEGPTCITCHEAVVPVGSGMRSSHTFDPIIPGELLTEEFQGDTCSGCHNDIATPDQLGLLIADIQENVQSRIETARAAVTETSPEWITQALDFVEGDGSFGIHNYAYADAVLDAVFEALGLAPVPGR